MIVFTATLQKFHDQGEKTGWTYIDVPHDLAEQLNPGVKKSYRVKGKLDNFSFEAAALTPMGEGNFILAVNAVMRKAIMKERGEEVAVQMEKDTKEKPLSGELLICLEDEPEALGFFNSLPKGHQRYFSNWIESAKTIETKTKRISQAINALAYKIGFGEMIRMNKKHSDF